MQVNFKRNFMIDGNFYAAGTRQVPDSFAKNWFVLALVKEGKAEFVADNSGAKKPAPPQAPKPPAQKQPDPSKTGKASEAKG